MEIRKCALLEVINTTEPHHPYSAAALTKNHIPHDLLQDNEVHMNELNSEKSRLLYVAKATVSLQ